MIQYWIAQPYEYIYWPLLNLRYIQIISTRLFLRSLRSLGRFSHRQDITLLHRTSRAGEVFASGSGGSGLPRFAFFTHYPGDVRRNGNWNPAMVGTLLWNFTGSTWFNLYDGRCPHFGCETAVCTILALLKMLASGQIWICRTVTMQIYDSYLLKALDVKLPYSEDSSSWSVGHSDALWCRCRRCCHAGWGASLSSLRQPDLRLGLQEQSLCGRRPGWAPCNACCRRSRLSIDMWGIDFLFMASQVGLSENWMLDHNFPHHSISPWIVGWIPHL